VHSDDPVAKPATFLLPTLRRKLNPAQYRRLMSYPVWNYLVQSIDASRAYDNGLDACLLLLQYTEDNRGEISRKEYEHNLQCLYTFLLSMLDKLDRWDDYLSLWEALRRNTRLFSLYARNGLEAHGNAIEPFVLEDDGESTRVHFLYGISHRKAIIERKLKRQLNGKRAALHGKQAELTRKQIQQRLDKLKARINYADQFRRK